jgi:hypothetical protein
LTVVVWVTLGSIVWTGCEKKSGTQSENAASFKKEKYQCAMHPQIVSDQPGHCPICSMKLEKVEDAPVDMDAQVPAGERKILFYRHPMRPDVTSPKRAKDEMGMDYIPVYADEADEDEVTDRTSSVAGHAPFRLSSERQQLIGVTTMKVRRQALKKEIRTVGTIAYDPELYTAVSEYREAVRARESIKDSPLPETHERSNALVKSSELRLRLLGLSDDQIQSLLAEDSDPINLLLPGKTAWVYGQIYESEIDLVHPGQKVVVTAPSLPGEKYYGKLTAIDPVLNATSRTLKVRAQIKTPEMKLRPEMFVHLYIQIPLGNKIAIPSDAVLNTGESKIVFVKKGAGRFEPRAIEIGHEANHDYEVLSGLEIGEEIVTSANFFIDSESRFRAAIAHSEKKK